MSLSLVNGYEDVASRCNLVANGRFNINQRQQFVTGVFAPIAINDFPADMWYLLNVTDASYIECMQHAYGALYFRGHGRKGQNIMLVNREDQALGSPGYLYGSGISRVSFCAGAEVMTAAADFDNHGDVSISARVYPWYGSSHTTLHDKISYLKSGDNKQAVRVERSVVDFAVYPARPAFLVQLLADGDFAFCVTNFRILAGAFRNPPVDAPVPYADDLVRCQRYYQSGVVANNKHVRAQKSNTDDARAMWPMPFQTKMAGTPTVAITGKYLGVWDGAGAIVDRISQENGTSRQLLASYANSEGFVIYTIWSEVTYAAQMYNNGVTLGITGWTATVA